MNQRHYQHWPKRVPKSLVYPRKPLYDYLEISARRYPDHPAIIYYGRRITYSELWDECLRLAGALPGMGATKGDRVALYLQNSPHFIIGFLGGMRAGAVVVPLNPMLVPKEFSHLLSDSGAKVVVTTTDLYPRIADACRDNGVSQIIVGSYKDYLPEKSELPVPEFMLQAPARIEGMRDWPTTLAKASGPPAETVGMDDLCLLPYTAGSTGVPKGCMHTHATITANIVSSMTWIQSSPAAVILSALPFFHVTGMVHSFLTPIAAGATSVLLTRWDRQTALTAIEKYEVTGWTNITTMLIDLLATPNLDVRRLSSLSAVGGGGAPLPAALSEKLKDNFGLSYMEGYGLTETMAQTHMNPPDRVKAGSMGIPAFDVDARIVDLSTLKELPVGEQGEIVIDAPQVFKGYWGKPEETEKAFMELDGKRFFRTGDIGYMDEEGYFVVSDRLKRMINAAGFKVWPTEVESVLYRHPAVLEACVISVPDAERVENVKALVVLKPEAVGKVSPEEIIKWSKGEMSAYKYPRMVEIVETLPKSGAGKVLWRQLQEEELAKHQKIAVK
ncbi:MAG: long-chain-fatty-acid--CoA ligase [Syntrophobacteraceae bacterium]|jgi:fatty-acyl-CoA synthase